nr:unnamed protein product [Digitaria exilis]
MGRRKGDLTGASPCCVVLELLLEMGRERRHAQAEEGGTWPTTEGGREVQAEQRTPPTSVCLRLTRRRPGEGDLAPHASGCRTTGSSSHPRRRARASRADGRGKATSRHTCWWPGDGEHALVAGG